MLSDKIIGEFHKLKLVVVVGLHRIFLGLRQRHGRLLHLHVLLSRFVQWRSLGLGVGKLGQLGGSLIQVGIHSRQRHISIQISHQLGRWSWKSIVIISLVIFVQPLINQYLRFWNETKIYLIKYMMINNSYRNES